MTPNDYLIAHIREALAAAPEVAALDLQIEVSGNSVFLSGTVDCDSKRQAARRVVESVAAGYTVINNTKILQLTPVEPAEVLHDSSGGYS